MGNMRTLEFQVPEELFPKIKYYLQRAAVSETPTDSERVAEEHTGRQETAAVSDCESVSEEVGEQPEEQESTDFSDDFDDDSEEYENPDEDEDLDESEDMGMAMGM